MKKIFRLFLVLVFLINFLTQPVIAQLSDAEQEERCQNNKNRVAELETQLRVIDADLAASMTKKEMEDARDKMVFIRSMRNKTKWTEAEKDRYEIVSYQYNFRHDECYVVMSKASNDHPYRRCIDSLTRIIATKIDRAVALDRLAILAKKKEVDQQLAAHRNNLIALGCDNKAKALSGACKMEGSWTQDTPGIGSTIWEIKKDGTATEKGIGYATGKAYLKGNTLHIDWKTGTGYSGYYEWTLDGTCTSGNGKLVFKTGRTDSLNSTVKRD